MRKDKTALIIFGIVIALVTCGLGLWWVRLHDTTKVNESAMEKARNADTSNFDNVLRF